MSPPFCRAATRGTQPRVPKLTCAFAALCIPSHGAWERLWEAEGSLRRPVPCTMSVEASCVNGIRLSLPKGVRRAGKSRQTHSELVISPASCGEHCWSAGRHRWPDSVGLPAILQSPRSLNHPRERENWKKLLGFS